MKYTIELTENQKKQMDLLCELAHRYIGFNPKLEPIKTTNVEDTNEYQIGYKVGFEDGTDRNLQGYYQKGLEDVNHALTVLENMTETEREEWFEDYASVGEVIHECTIQRIIKSTKEYEEKKKAEEEIRVGDEVICNCPNEQRVIITAKYDGLVTFMRKDGACYSRAETGIIKKTGRHFEEISQLLNKLRGEE